MEYSSFINILETSLAQTPRTSPERVFTSRRRAASVLVPLVMRDGELCVLFEERSHGIRQGGEICFPGGRVEAGESSTEAALRETAEELCLPPGEIRILAPLHVSRGPGGAEVTSWLGLLDRFPDRVAQEEVARVFTLPLQELMEMQPLFYDCRDAIQLPEDFPYHLIPGGRDYPWQKNPHPIYIYETREAVIWGITGMLLFHCLEWFRTLQPG